MLVTFGHNVKEVDNAIIEQKFELAAKLRDKQVRESGSVGGHVADTQRKGKGRRRVPRVAHLRAGLGAAPGARRGGPRARSDHR